MMTKWIIFDAMGVLFVVGDDANELLVPFVQERNPAVSREQVIASYRRASLGAIDAAQFWREVGLGQLYPEVEENYLSSQLTLDRAVASVAESLASRYRIGLLSNDVSVWSMYLRRKHRLHFFNAAIISGDVHLRKPDPRIYQSFLQTAGTTGAECVFVDDRAKNLIPARSLGMKTILFAGTQDAAFAPDAFAERAELLSSAIERVCQPAGAGDAFQPA
jgi:HAD superfamily hydrolase (TIGR01509 family)